MLRSSSAYSATSQSKQPDAPGPCEAWVVGEVALGRDVGGVDAEGES
jgi:hypothetical protein